jgi:hypothetical protein
MVVLKVRARPVTLSSTARSCHFAASAGSSAFFLRARFRPQQCHLGPVIAYMESL